MTQGINEQIGFVSAVEPKSHFLTVGLKMLRADSVPRTHDASLEKRECGLDRIGVNISLGIDAKFVSDGLVPAIFPNVPCRASISLPIIRVQDVYIFADVLADILFERAALGVLGMEEAEIAAALSDADYNFLPLVQGIFPLPPILAAYVCFVHLDFSREHWPLAFDHCGPDAMTEVPRCLVAAEAERTLNLASRHALLRFAEKQSGEKPFVKGQVGIVEDRAGGDGELIVTVFAVVESLFGFKFHDFHFAARAADTLRPAQASKQFAALLIGRKHGVYIN